MLKFWMVELAWVLQWRIFSMRGTDLTNARHTTATLNLHKDWIRTRVGSEKYFSLTTDRIYNYGGREGRREGSERELVGIIYTNRIWLRFVIICNYCLSFLCLNCTQCWPPDDNFVDGKYQISPDNDDSLGHIIVGECKRDVRGCESQKARPIIYKFCLVSSGILARV